MELSEGGIVYLSRSVPHGYRITSKRADLLMICTPAGIEGMFRRAGRDRATPRPDGFEIRPDRLAEAAEMFGNLTYRASDMWASSTSAARRGSS